MPAAWSEPTRGLRKETWEGIGEYLCHDIYHARLYTTVSLTANTPHGGQLSPSVPRPVGPKPSLAARANRVINGLPEHAVVRHLLSMVQAGNNGF